MCSIGNDTLSQGHKILAMRLYLTLLTSLALHALLVFAVHWPSARAPETMERIDVRLMQVETPPELPVEEPVSETTIAPEPALPPAPAPPPPPPRAQSPAPVPPPPPPSAVAPAPKKLDGNALRRAQSVLSQHLSYPPEAVERGLEGEVLVLLTLDEQSRVIKAELARSSGHPLLDQAALVAARRLGALPGNPRQTLLPVSFQLQ